MTSLDWYSTPSLEKDFATASRRAGDPTAGMYPSSLWSFARLEMDSVSREGGSKLPKWVGSPRDRGMRARPEVEGGPEG